MPNLKAWQTPSHFVDLDLRLVTGVELQMIILQKDKSIYILKEDKTSLCRNGQEGKGRCIPLEWETGLFFTKWKW